MIKATASLYILIFNKHSMMHDVVSLKEESLVVPTIEISVDKSLDDTLSNLFESVVDLSRTYARYKLCDASVINDTLSLAYFCVLPFGTRIKNAFLLPSKNYENYSPNLQKIIKLF